MKKLFPSSLSQRSNKNTMPKLVSGFTLIEIVVVIAIMGVLSTIIYSSFDASRAKSRDQKRVSDISAIQLSLEQYFNKNGVYPTTLDALVPAYMPEIPKDPTTNTSYRSNYIPFSKIPGLNANSCVSYQLWTKFERSNSWLESKKGFDSTNINHSQAANGFYDCVTYGNNHSGLGIDASSTSNALVYDVMP